jgi:STE24 endopeptidase
VNATVFSWLFVAFLVAMTLTRLWLSSRQIRHVAQHRSAVPEQFAQTIPLSAHQKAADYTLERTRFGLIDILFGAALTLGFTLLGGLSVLQSIATQLLPDSALLRQLLIIVLFGLVATVLEWPFDWYRQFTIEAKHGFNRMTKGLFISDQIKGLALGAAIGLPLIAAIIWIMQNAPLWWFWAWVLWVSFSLTMMIIGPSIIIPLFNKLEPLPDGALKDRVQALMKRCNFEANGLFVMDGSKRSSHGNAFFAGMGKSRRIVLFDTIVTQLNEPEIEAVLAHELGHFKRKHIIKRIVPSLLLVLPAFWLIDYLMHQTWFFQGLGVTVPLTGKEHQGVALVLFMLAFPVFSFFIEPLSGIFSRKHEFEADEFAAQHSNASDLINALVKLYKDNASTLTPDPIHSAFYDSHPPASIRIGRLNTLATK